MRRDDVSLSDPPFNDRPGDRWMCGRTGDESPCAHGPNRHGVCPLAEACRPRATWHGTRRKISIAAIALLAFALLMISQSALAPKVFKPGKLATPHAQILSGTLTSARCASCHSDAATSPTSWFASAGEGHIDVGQTDRCLNCHHNQIDPQRAKLAHNLPANVRAEIRLASIDSSEHSWHDLLPGPAIEMDNLECAACHREHRGADADLMAVSDTQCQTCHSDRFGGFATSHPAWTQWPYGRGGDIAFDHVSHATKHFPASQSSGQTVEFHCMACHTATSDKELARTTSYESACQSCHDPSLRLEASAGIELLALPTVPADASESIGPWPESATGFYDGKISPLAEILFRSDEQVANAVRRIPDRDFGRVNESMPSMVAATVTVAKAHRELLEQIDREGQSAIIGRASAIGIPLSTLEPLIRAFPTQLVGDTHRRWFATVDPSIARRGEGKISIGADVRLSQYRDFNTPPPTVLVAAISDGDSLLAPDDGNSLLLESVGDELLSNDPPAVNDDLLGGDDELLGSDQLDGDPLSIDVSEQKRSTAPVRFDATKMLPVGGWYRDDLRLAIAYRGNGHNDPVLRSAIEMLSGLSAGDPVRQRLLATRSIAACVRCHPTAAISRGAWRSAPTIGRSNDFTKFSHSPHLKIAGMADCVHCHQLRKSATHHVNLVNNTNSPSSNLDEFEPLLKESCAACHTQKAAGEACIKCHRYHMGE